MEEEQPAAVQAAGLASTGAFGVVTSPARRLSDIEAVSYRRISTGIAEFDRVLGGGMVPGGVSLIAGPPGAGKSTLLIQAAEKIANAGHKVLIASGEESVEQIKLRADRLGLSADNLYLCSENDLSSLLAHVAEISPAVLIVDSIQTFASSELPGRLGSMSQVTEVTSAITRISKERQIATFLCGHVTKDDNIAGPRIVEHLVDMSASLAGDRTTPMRLLSGIKNRFGSLDIGCFLMEGNGMVEVSDPSTLFLGERSEPAPGVCVSIVIEGRRALAVEVQALTVQTQAPNPRRSANGLDHSRVATLIAVAEKHGRVRLANRDVFVSTIGGIRIQEPVVDLAVVLAMASAEADAAMPAGVAAIGEVALSGDVRPVVEMERRVTEAVRRGFGRILVPAGVRGRVDVKGATLIEVGNVGRALEAQRQMSAHPQG